MKEAIDILKVLAEKLGTTTEYLWTVLVMQGRVELAKSAVAVLVAIIGIPVLIRSIFKTVGDANADLEVEHRSYGDIKNWKGEYAAIVAAKLVFVVLLLAFGISSFASLASPEAWALNQVLSMFGGK